MKKASLLIVVAATLLLVAGCFPFGSAGKELDEEFALSIGEAARINGEELRVEFVEVIEDSRCPSGATCIWQGRVSVKLEITYLGDPYDMVLIQYGLYDGYDTESYQGYQFTYKVEPYPEVNKQIDPSDYRLVMTVSKE